MSESKDLGGRRATARWYAKNLHRSRWENIRTRCHNARDPSFQWYGARGIGIYAPWLNDYQAFATYLDETLGPCPLGHSLDRIDNDGHYEPGNLRWATAQTQSLNSRRWKRKKGATS